MKDYINKRIAANYFRWIESVGGSILFDETGFTFSSHVINIQTGKTRIHYSNILEIQKRKTLGIIPNGIVILTRDGIKHRFVINNRDSVIEFLLSKRR